MLYMIFQRSKITIDCFFEVETATINVFLFTIISLSIKRPFIYYIVRVVESKVNKIIDVAQGQFAIF